MILITGATGFIGNAVVMRILKDPKLSVRLAIRQPLKVTSLDVENVETALVGELTGKTDWSRALDGVDVVVHAAARAHIMRDKADDPLSEFRRVNVDGTLHLAQVAAAAGVKRFIFISSIKVNGEETLPGKPYTADDQPNPTDPYGISKHEAEQRLRKLSLETGIEIVIIRPVLVYGSGVKANFLSMMKYLYKGWPLPLGSIHNKRSLVSLDNLVDLIYTCLYKPTAANQTFLVSDGEDISITDLLKKMAHALGKEARLLSVPQYLLEKVARLFGKRDMFQRLCSSLQVDMIKTKTMLGWEPPLSISKALEKTAKCFIETVQSNSSK